MIMDSESTALPLRYYPITLKHEYYIMENPPPCQRLFPIFREIPRNGQFALS